MYFIMIFYNDFEYLAFLSFYTSRGPSIIQFVVPGYTIYIMRM